MSNMALNHGFLPLGKEQKRRRMRIDTRIIIEDIIKVGLKTRKKSPKERNVIDIKNETLFASNVGKRDTLNFQRKINKLDISRNLKDKLMSILE